jgi:hypothetical protein
MLDVTAFGFTLGQRVRMLTESEGEDHLGIEHRLPPGAIAIIDQMEFKIGDPDWYSFTLWIPIDESKDRGIVNVLDPSDGPITDFITPIDAPQQEKIA